MIGNNISNQICKSRGKFIFENAVAEKFPEMINDIQIQEAKWILKSLSAKKFSTRHKRTPAKGSLSEREKLIIFQGATTKLTAGFSATVEARY